MPRDTTAFDLALLIRDLLENFDEVRAGRLMKVPLLTEDAEPSGECSTITQAVIDLDDTVYAETDDGLRFKVKITKSRTSRLPQSRRRARFQAMLRSAEKDTGA